MKIVFITLFVLTIVSTASAEIRISIEGSKYPQGEMHFAYPNVPLQLGIWTDSQISAGIGEWDFALTTDERYCTISGGDSYFPVEPAISIYDDARNAGYPLPDGENGVGGIIYVTVLSSIRADSVIFNNINFNWDGSNFTIAVPVNLFGYDGINDKYIYLDTALVYLAPEPTTIGLFGIGALLLRKNKSVNYLTPGEER